MDQGPQLGFLINNDEMRRDAIHIAVAPATAAERLSPGEHVGFAKEGDTQLVGSSAKCIGIVDPFLRWPVEPGQRFWVFLYPGTITGLRHVWTHPAFSSAAADVKVKMEEREAFLLRELAANEDDLRTRLVFADWLDASGQHAEADRHRKWPAAKSWLIRFCQKYNAPDTREITYDYLIKAGMSQVYDGQLMSPRIDCGNNEDICNALRENCDEFWKNWSILTGIRAAPEEIQLSHFSCAC